MATIWLILLTAYGGSQLMHVGNFKTMASCLAAAKSSQTYVGSGIASGYTFYCVPANESGTSPPVMDEPNKN